MAAHEGQSKPTCDVVDHTLGDSNVRTNRAPLGGKSKAGGIAIALALVAYSFAAPALNARFGWNLPQIRVDSNSQVNPQNASRNQFDGDSDELVADRNQGAAKTIRDPSANSDRPVTNPPESDSNLVASKPPEIKQPNQQPDMSRSPGPLAGRLHKTADSQRGPPGDQGKDSNERSAKAIDDADTADIADRSDQTELRYGLLREISSDRFISPAGLLYTPGSAEGHRLEHLRRHTQNDPGRPGSHGVFDGGMEGTLATVDQAYERAKKGQRTTKKTDQDRTIYTVDMGKRVGYVGGRDGGRRRNPMARRVRLVLEGNRVITAYPM